MFIKNLQVGHLDTNCYIVMDEDTLSCAVIDPGDESNTILDYIENNHLTVSAIFITHGHFDHVGAVQTVAEDTGAPVYMHRGDVCGKEEDNEFAYQPTEGVRFYREGDQIAVGGLNFLVLETPGHSPGSVTLQCEKALFCGDLLFKDSVGRTDLPGGDFDTLMESLRKLAGLPGDYEVYPGHLECTTLDGERMMNQYVRYAVNGKV